MVQIAIIKLLGYREWIESLGYDREHIVQNIQSRIHNVLSYFALKYEVFVHPLRYDYTICVSTNLKYENYLDMMKTLSKVVPVPIAIGVAKSSKPKIAELKASRLVNKANSWEILFDDDNDDSLVVTAHLDLVNSTDLTKQYSIYQSYKYILDIICEYMKIVDDMGGLTLYLGGDNCVAILDENFDEDVLRRFCKLRNVRIGVGISKSIRKAFALSAQALHKLRQRNLIDVLKLKCD